MRKAGHIVRRTLQQVLGVRRVLLFGALVLLPALVLYFQVRSPGSAGSLSEFLEGTSAFFFVPLPITALILATSVLGSERRDETLSFLVVRPIGRVTIAGAKLVSAFVAALMITAAGALALGVVYGIESSDWAYLGPMLVGVAIATVVYAAIFVPVGYLTERSALIGLAFIFIWEAGIVGPLEALGVTSPWRIGYSAFVALAPAEMSLRVDSFTLANLTPDFGQAMLQFAVYVVLSIAFTTWLLQTRDLV